MNATETNTAPPRSGLVAVYTLTLLLLVNVINYADRALLGASARPCAHKLDLQFLRIPVYSQLTVRCQGLNSQLYLLESRHQFPRQLNWGLR